MIKDHSDSKIGNSVLPHGLLFPISSKNYFICNIPHRIAHTMASRGALAGRKGFIRAL